MFKSYLVHIAWLQAFIATSVSLFFSEIVKIPVCSLCWYQRIFMYPLVIILGVGLLKKDSRVADYALPLSVTGLLIAVYQYLMQMGVIPAEFAPCSTGVACNNKDINLFGFVTIVLLSAMAFTVISICLIIYRKK